MNRRDLLKWIAALPLVGAVGRLFGKPSNFTGSVKWSVEVAPDVRAFHTLDAEAELLAATETPPHETTA